MNKKHTIFYSLLLAGFGATIYSMDEFGSTSSEKPEIGTIEIHFSKINSDKLTLLSISVSADQAGHVMGSALKRAIAHKNRVAINNVQLFHIAADGKEQPIKDNDTILKQDENIYCRIIVPARQAAQQEYKYIN
jgi:hypothetical protein